MNQLLEEGLILNNDATDIGEKKIVHVKHRCFICDSPARAMIKGSLSPYYLTYKMLSLINVYLKDIYGYYEFLK